jgi:hypothetical protein
MTNESEAQGGANQGSALSKAIHDLEQAEGDLKKGDLKHAEDEARAAVEDIEAAERDDLITIVVDGVDRRVRPGKWIVRDLKAALGIDPAKVLAEITPQGLKDLDDGAEIEVHRKEQFMTHARSGGSS